MNIIAVSVITDGPSFSAERHALYGCVRQALNDLIDPYGCEVRFVEPPGDGSVDVVLFSGEGRIFGARLDGEVCFVRRPPSDASVNWRADVGSGPDELYLIDPGQARYEYSGVADGVALSDVFPFVRVALVVLSAIIVSRAAAVSVRKGIPVDPLSAFELAVTLQRIGLTPRPDHLAPRVAFHESSRVISELRSQLSISHGLLSIEELDRMESINRSRLEDLEVADRQNDSWTAEETAWPTVQRVRNLMIGALGSRWIARIATDPKLRHESASHPIPGSEDRSATVALWYGTNRAPASDDQGSVLFANGEEDPGLHVGKCVVRVPTTHNFGSSGSPRWTARLSKGARGESLTLTSVDQAHSVQSFKDSLSGYFAPRGQRNRVLVYVHGFNTSFEGAAVRAAQIGHDLRYPGAVAFFSWPSFARFSKESYIEDSKRAQASAGSFIDFLALLGDAVEAIEIDVVVHSMGNQTFTRSVMVGLKESGIVFGSVILAAPDVHVPQFVDAAPFFSKICSKITMYVSEGDLALIAAGIVQPSDRAGFAPPVTVVSGVDTVEVSSVDFSLLGHGYYAQAHGVLYDMKQILEGVHDPARRVRLAPAVSPNGRYWRILKTQ